MYLAFDLPDPRDNNPSAHTVAFCIHRELDKWGNRYQIEFKTKYHKNRLRLIFPIENEYHFFMLTWSPNTVVSGHSLPDIWLQPRAVEVPKH